MSVTILNGDCRDVLRTMSAESVNCIVTSPPYFGLRDYGVEGQIGLEQTPDEYVAEMVGVFAEARRVLRDDGTVWLNLGDSYNSSPPGNKNPMSKSGLNGAQTSASYRARLEETQQRQQERRGLITGLKPKDLLGIPWRVAFALQADGWYLRQDIIWHKPNPMPESVQDRCTKAHEYVFLLSKSPRYLFDAEAIREPNAINPNWNYGSETYRSDVSSVKTETGAQYQKGKKGWSGFASSGPDGDGRNKRSVWTIATQPYSEAHFATMAPELARTCIMAGCPLGGTVLDPFGGAGTTGLVADQLSRNAILIELNPTYADLARNRITADAGMFGEVESGPSLSQEEAFQRAVRKGMFDGLTGKAIREGAE